MRQISEVLHASKPVMLMLVVQIGYAGMNILYKLAANDGMNLRILVTYRCTFATAFIAPLALIFERKKRPKLTWTVLSQAFFCGFFGLSVAQNLYVEGMALTSATFVVVVFNLVPAFTLILAILFRLEKVNLKTATGRAKVLGILTGIGGAMFLTFYKGVEINIGSTNFHILKHNHQHQHSHSGSRILGAFLTIIACISYAGWLIIQTKMSKRYPCHYSSTALVSLMGSIQCVIVSICMERDWSQWNLVWNVRLLAAAYSGIVTSGLAVVLIAWCVNIRGPVFVASFNPLTLVIVAVAGSLILEENLYLGSILGAVLIVCGLYMVLWGQSKDIKAKAKLMPINGSPESRLEEIVTSSDESTLNASIDEDSLPKKHHCQNKTEEGA